MAKPDVPPLHVREGSPAVGAGARKLVRALGAIVLAGLAGGCIGQPRAAAPQARLSIVSLNPCSDAILAEVADPAQVLAISHYSHDPRSSSMDPAVARRFRATRGTVEEVVALRPDVVIGSTFTAPATVAAYGRLGLRLEALPMASTVEESRQQVRALAALAGHPERGEALVARMDAALAAAAPRKGAIPVPTVVWQSGGMVPGDGTLIADLLRRTGFAHFSAARGLRQADILPLERMLADPPRLILTTSGRDTGEGREDRVLSHPALDALADTARAQLDPTLLYCGGPTIIRAAARLAQVRERLDPAAAHRRNGPR